MQIKKQIYKLLTRSYMLGGAGDKEKTSRMLFPGDHVRKLDSK